MARDDQDMTVTEFEHGTSAIHGSLFVAATPAETGGQWALH